MQTSANKTSDLCQQAAACNGGCLLLDIVHRAAVEGLGVAVALDLTQALAQCNLQALHIGDVDGLGLGKHGPLKAWVVLGRGLRSERNLGCMSSLPHHHHTFGAWRAGEGAVEAEVAGVSREELGQVDAVVGRQADGLADQGAVLGARHIVHLIVKVKQLCQEGQSGVCVGGLGQTKVDAVDSKARGVVCVRGWWQQG